MPTRSPALSPRDSLRRSLSPRSPSRYPDGSRSPSVTRSYRRGRTRSRSFSRDRDSSRSPRRASGRWPRDRSYTRSLTPRSPRRSSKIVVEKLTKNVTEGHLYDIFGTFGAIQNVDLPLNKTFMTNRGTAYILYQNPADAEAAVSSMHEAQVDGAILKVSIVLPRRVFSRSPPPARRAAAGDAAFSQGRQSLHNDYHSADFSRASPPRRRSPKRTVNGGAQNRRGTYRPPSLSRSPSPRRPRHRSHSPYSDSDSQPRRRDSRRRRSPRYRRRRSPSYSSYSSRDGYSSLSDRDRSPSRSRGHRPTHRRR